MVKSKILDLPMNGRVKNLKGQTFGRLTVLEYVGITENTRRAVWKCQCECGNIDNYLGQDLRNGATQSCGCYHKDIISKDISGQRFGKLIAKERTNKIGHANSYLWICDCDCGGTIEVSTNDLITGNISSCGCLRSRKEWEIANYLDSQDINYKQQYWFEDLKDQRPLRFDFAILDSNNNLKFLLEYNGVQHTNENDNWHKETIAMHDQMKIEYCKKHNIPLLIIDKDNYVNINNLIKELL